MDSLLLQGALGKKEGVVFLRRVDNPVPTMKFLPREKNGKGNASIQTKFFQICFLTKYKLKSKKLLFEFFSIFFSFFNVLLYVNSQVVFRSLASFLRRLFVSFLRRALYNA